MIDEPDGGKRDRGLNPALKSRRETSHNTSESSQAPFATASVQREEGRAWPMIWLVIAIIGLLILLYLAFG
ncbi:hypothetical protein [Chelativorans sp. Marseille-P2723]|uniref:hypothetical protein n=1 Tax=Chelativorans sp. Marseille-P2723 TaxID=2709133 RepID=UPI00156E8CDF|nr:hypothetical protein [Chelativorans sp. Marseille-P2723]